MGALMGLTLLVLLVQDIPLAFYLRQVENDRLVTSLERDAFVLGGRAEEVLEHSTPEGLAELTEFARDYQAAGGARVVIVDRDGVAIVTSDADDSRVGSSYLSRPEIAAALSGSIQSGTRYSETLQQELMYVAVPVFSGEDVPGAVRLTYPLSVVTDAVTARLQVLGTVALTSALLAGFAGFVFSNTVTRRLRLLESVTEVLAAGDLSARADDTSGAPEIRALSRSFNTMADRLSGMIDQQRAFAADASHQLRTPLTALRLRLESARELVDTDPTTAADRLAAAEIETDRLLTIIEGLLLLSRTDSASTPLVTVDVARVAQERVDHWHALAQELGVTLSYAGPVRAHIHALDHAVEQVVDNYVDNALTASPAGTDIVVGVETHGDLVTVSVADSGPGLTAEQCTLAFDRFWQADSDGGGSGLGLAIVKRLVELSGGTVSLEPRKPRGLIARATFRASGVAEPAE